MDTLLKYLTQDVKDNIKECISKGNVHFIIKNNTVIGFHTWMEDKDRIFINNLWIEEQYRNKNNLFSLRKYFRDMYPGRKLYWRDRKKGKMVQYD